MRSVNPRFTTSETLAPLKRMNENRALLLSAYRWNHGPFSREVLHSLQWMGGIEVVESTVSWDGGAFHTYRPGTSTRLSKVDLDTAFVKVLDWVGDRWRNRSLKDLLEHVYGAERVQDKAFGQPLL